MPYKSLSWSNAASTNYKPGTGTYFELFPDAPKDKQLTIENREADDFQRERYWLALNSKSPSNWTSDHLQQSQRLRGAVFVAIKVLSDQASTAEINFYKWSENARLGQDQDAKEPLDRDHPLCRLFHRPNSQDSKGMMMRRVVQQLCLTGSSLMWRIDDGNDVPKELWTIPTGAYQPVPMSSKYPDGAYSIQTWFPGPLAYIPGILPVGGAIVDARNILVARYPHPLVYNEGQSPLDACQLPMDTLESIDRARFTKMRRGIYPSAIATLDGQATMPDAALMLRIRQQINQVIGGPDKAGVPAILSPGMKLETFGSDNIEMGWVDSYNQLISFVLSVYGVTKSLAFMSEETSFAALYASLMQFNLFTLCPLLNLFTDAVNHQLVHPFFGEDICVEFKPRPIHDEETKERAFTNDFRIGLRTINEVRVARGLSEVPWGDQRAWDKDSPISKAWPDDPSQNRKPELQDPEKTEANSPAPKEDPTMKNKRPENRVAYGTRPRS